MSAPNEKCGKFEKLNFDVFETQGNNKAVKKLIDDHFFNHSVSLFVNVNPKIGQFEFLVFLGLVFSEAEQFRPQRDGRK